MGVDIARNGGVIGGKESDPGPNNVWVMHLDGVGTTFAWRSQLVCWFTAGSFLSQEGPSRRSGLDTLHAREARRKTTEESWGAH